MWHVEEYSSLLPGVSLPYMWHISTNLVYSYPTCGMLRDTMYCYCSVSYCPTCGMLRDAVYCYWLTVLLPCMWHVEGYSVLLLVDAVYD